MESRTKHQKSSIAILRSGGFLRFRHQVVGRKLSAEYSREIKEDSWLQMSKRSPELGVPGTRSSEFQQKLCYALKHSVCRSLPGSLCSSGIFRKFYLVSLLRYLLCAVVFLLLPAALCAHSDLENTLNLNLTPKELAWLDAHPVIRVAPDPDFPPVEFFDKDGRYQGISAEFIALLEKKLPLKFKINQLVNWDEVLRQARAKEIDMISAAVPTPDRLQYLKFSRPFVEFSTVIMVRDSVTDFPKLKNLTGKRVAVVSGYADHEYMKRVYPDVPLEVMPDISAGLRQVSFGRVDAMILNLASASYYIRKDGILNLKVSEDTTLVHDLSFAVRDDWPLLVSILDKGMAAVTPQERKAILDNWISLGKEGWTPSPVMIVTVVAIFLLLVLLVILQWNRTLKQQVRQRTMDLQTELEERLLAQQEKEKLQQQVHSSKKMEAMGLLAGGVAHDLNNIISGVTGYAELMLMKLPKDSPFCKHAAAIHDSGQRAAAVVADMLTISRDAASDKKVVNLNHLIKEYLRSPEHVALRERFPQVDYACELSAELFNVSCSTTHIKKAIMNLVINAAEATEQGSVSISTENCYIDRPFGIYGSIEIGEYVLLRVVDSGSGIAAADIEHIFEPFYSRKTKGTSGTGLGLAVVWNTVQEHLGYIDVEQPGTGSCFNLYLPITRDEYSPAEIETSSDALHGTGEHILIVDDEDQIRDLATQMLSSLGYRVAQVSSGEAAIDYLRKQKVDLLLLDMIMDPGINGCQTYQQAVALHPGQRALICSGFSESAEVLKAQAAGAGAYLKKPYTLAALGQAVKDELAR